jgi:hypothetical protein
MRKRDDRYLLDALARIRLNDSTWLRARKKIDGLASKCGYSFSSYGDLRQDLREGYEQVQAATDRSWLVYGLPLLTGLLVGVTCGALTWLTLPEVLYIQAITSSMSFLLSSTVSAYGVYQVISWQHASDHDLLEQWLEQERQCALRAMVLPEIQVRELILAQALNDPLQEKIVLPLPPAASAPAIEMGDLDLLHHQGLGDTKGRTI